MPGLKTLSNKNFQPSKQSFISTGGARKTNKFKLSFFVDTKNGNIVTIFNVHNFVLPGTLSKPNNKNKKVLKMYLQQFAVFNNI